MYRLAGLLLLCVVLSAAACASLGERGTGGDERTVEATTTAPGGLVPLGPPDGRAMVNRPIELGSGDCAPRYTGTLVGTCINNQPCRGFGERDERGTLHCTCFARREGCAETERCDLQQKACVPLGEPPFKRTPAQ